MLRIVVYTDGGSRGNPGPSAIGVVVKKEDGSILQTISQTIGETTNNVAEYQAVVCALEWLKNNYQIIQLSNYQIVQFFLDSRLVVNQLNGLFKVKDGNLRNLLVEIRQLEQEIGGNIIYSLIPREKNSQADGLVNRALDNSITY